MTSSWWGRGLIKVLKVFFCCLLQTIFLCVCEFLLFFKEAAEQDQWGQLVEAESAYSRLAASLESAACQRRDIPPQEKVRIPLYLSLIGVHRSAFH